MKNRARLRLPTITLLATWLALFTLPALSDVAIGEGDYGEEPLMPEQAFILTTSATGADMIRAEWQIADAYYMYRSKFKFTSNTPGVTLGEAIYPKGKIKEDEFFGKVETYRHSVTIDIPIIREAGANTLELMTVSQGCADMGICYPPQKVPASIALPAMAAASPSSSSIDPIAALKNFGQSLGLTSGDDEFLRVDEAFSFSAEVENANTIKASWEVEDGYYLYRDKFKFEIQDAEGITIGKINMPKGKEKVDQSFGKMVVYAEDVDIFIPLVRTNLDPVKLTLIAKYQGCAEKGFCYPPQTKPMPLSLPKATQASLPVDPATDSTSGDGDGYVSETDEIANSLASGNALLIILSFFGFGLLLAFTPCVFPMIPILSSIIIGQGDSITTRRAFIMSTVYVLAMALTYTGAGVIAGLFGENLQAAFQNPWILGSFSAVFVALAFSMFGFYDIQMPGFIQSKLTEFSNKQEGGTLAGVAIMGLLSALIVGPCVAAPLAGALIYIGQTGDAVLGGMALFALSMGMGAPLIAIGTSAGKLLPRAGTWMDAVKGVFGVAMLAVAIWMLERIVPVEVTMALWATLLIVSGIYMGAIEPIGEGKSGWYRLWKGMGLVALIYGALLLIGVASGGKEVMQPLMGINTGGGAGGTAVAHKEMQFKRIRGLDQLDSAIASANAQGKMVMLDLYADWCISCKEMEKYTFSDPGVQAALGDTLLLQADVTANDEIDKALLKKFGLVGPPSIMFFGTDGKEKRKYRLVGFLSADKFRALVEKAKN